MARPDDSDPCALERVKKAEEGFARDGECVADTGGSEGVGDESTDGPWSGLDDGFGFRLWRLLGRGGLGLERLDSRWCVVGLASRPEPCRPSRAPARPRQLRRLVARSWRGRRSRSRPPRQPLGRRQSGSRPPRSSARRRPLRRSVARRSRCRRPRSRASADAASSLGSAGVVSSAAMAWSAGSGRSVSGSSVVGSSVAEVSSSVKATALLRSGRPGQGPVSGSSRTAAARGGRGREAGR